LLQILHILVCTPASQENPVIYCSAGVSLSLCFIYKHCTAAQKEFFHTVNTCVTTIYYTIGQYIYMVGNLTVFVPVTTSSLSSISLANCQFRNIIFWCNKVGCSWIADWVDSNLSN